MSTLLNNSQFSVHNFFLFLITFSYFRREKNEINLLLVSIKNVNVLIFLEHHIIYQIISIYIDIC